MKIAVNACFGGFRLSRAAIVALAVTDCPHIERHDPEQYYNGNGRNPDWREQFEEDMRREVGRIFGPPLVLDGKIITDEHRSGGDARACPRLVSVVEAMGKDASDTVADIRIVEIPDQIQFTIEEYDGNEHVAQVHQTWYPR